MKNEIGILRFNPLFRNVRWGGTALARFKGLSSLPSDKVGESWEISGLPGFETAVAEGPLKGLTVTQLMEKYGNEIMGETLYRKYGDFFPILVKFIDAEDDLSIQVHPGDENAPDSHGKNELWYVVGSEPGSYIYSGFNRPLTLEKLSRAMNDNTLVTVLARHYTSAGDMYYVPSGRIHSIGAGNLILEIQQTSGITYRLHDYDRKDKSGHRRQLHIEEALNVIDYSPSDFGLARPQMLIDRETIAKITPDFTVTTVQVMDKCMIDNENNDSPRILICIAGKGVVTDDTGHSASISRGQTLLVPAVTSNFEIKAISTPLKVITVYI